MRIIGMIGIVLVVWCLISLVWAFGRQLWRRAHHQPAGSFWEDFFWLWLEALNPLNYL